MRAVSLSRMGSAGGGGGGAGAGGLEYYSNGRWISQMKG